MKRKSIKLLLSLIALPVSAQTFTEVQGAFPFNAFALNEKSQISAADLNHPITQTDRITVSSDGHLYANGKRLRIFGTNLSDFPKTHEEAVFVAKSLAKQGYNCIRFHHTDADWTDCFIKKIEGGKRVLNKPRLDDFDYFFAQLKENGIYTNINLLTGRTFTNIDGLKNEINNVKDWKNRECLGFWDEKARDVQKKWAETLLTHKNPYTNTSYFEDPALAIVEINNENGMLQAYLCGNLEDYTGSYWQELEDLWNDWLIKKDYSYDILSSKYNITTPKGNDFISPSKKWNVENHEGAKSVYSCTNGTHTIKVTENGQANWHIQMNYAGLKIESNKIYTISLSAKSLKPASVSVSIMQAHNPWENAGFNKKIELTNQWQNFSFTVTGLTSDSNDRINIGEMGFGKGNTFYYKDIQIQEGGDVIQICEGKKSTKENKSVLFPHKNQYDSMPSELKNLILNFLWDIEDNYWRDMADYIKNTLNSKSLLMGTIVGCSTEHLQSHFDIIDTHAYWNHPVFPKTSWDKNNYYVSNKTLLKADSDNTLTNCGKYRVYGKPFSVSEYDHPYPNQYQAEMYPMIAAYASFQDWDALFTFCYSLPKTKDGQNEKITDFFDQGHTPVKTCAAPIASRIFRDFCVSPAKNAYYVPISKETEKSNLYRNHGWSIGEPSIYGLNKTLGLISRIGITLDETSIPDNAILVTKEISDKIGTKYTGFSDNNELYWDENSGLFIVCSEKATVTAACKTAVFPEPCDDWKITGRLMPLSNITDFAVMAAVRKDNKYSGFAASWNGNRGDMLSQYGSKNPNPAVSATTKEHINLTTISNLGVAPAYALGITGKTELYKTNGKFYYADLKGNSIPKTIQRKNFTFKPDCNSLWFIIEG